MLCLNCANIQESLRKIADDTNQHLTTHDEASRLSKKIDKLEIAFLCNMWNTILQRFYKTSTTLQTVDIDLSFAVDFIRSLRDFVVELSLTLLKQRKNKCLQQCLQWPSGSRGLLDRALDLKPEVTQGCGFESRLRQEVSMTEVRPLSKAPIPQTAPWAPHSWLPTAPTWMG